jgi:NAD(P)H-hydrate epimerase
MGVLTPDAVKPLREALPKVQGLLVGPGLTQEQETIRFVHELLGAGLKTRPGTRIGFTAAADPPDAAEEEDPALPPMVIDADALNALAGSDEWPHWLQDRRAVLTPHPGEMARLLHLEDAGEVQQQRWETVREAATQWGQIVVLKGAHTVIGFPDGRVVVSPFANPALATAGTGDVLAGLIVGLLAQGVQPDQAAIAGVYLHGLAAEQMRNAENGSGLLAGDLALRIPVAMQALRQL